MRRTLTTAAALLCAAALTLAGCAEAPGTGTETSAQPSASGSASASVGGVQGLHGYRLWRDRRPLVQPDSLEGPARREGELGIETGQVESNTKADFAKNNQSMVDDDCGIVVTVGFLLGDDTLARRKSNPEDKFAIVDNIGPETYPSVRTSSR